MAAPRRGRLRLGPKLFASHLVVVVVGLVTLLLAADLSAPRFFAAHMAGMGMRGPMPMPMAASEAALDAAFRGALAQALLLAGGMAAVAAIGASAFVAARIVGPIQRLASASRRLADGHYAERVPASGDDELGELAASFNELAAALEATERRRLELIGDVAHELRTPIATLRGYLEGLLDGVVAPEAATWATLHDETARLARLVDDLQELSRAEARQLPLNPTALDPGEVVGAATGRLAGAFAEQGLTLSVELAAGLPPVWADRDRAVQVLTNLLTNALRYTPAPGAVRVTAQRDDHGVRVSVADTGLGIAAEHLPRLFERFYRVDKSRSRALGGSGVGLTIARALVEAMGGRIWAESEGPGRGATFSFTLPLAR